MDFYQRFYLDLPMFQLLVPPVYDVGTLVTGIVNTWNAGKRFTGAKALKVLDHVAIWFIR